MGQSLLPPLESTSEIRVLYMYICQKGLYYWKRKWKEFTEEVVPIYIPQFCSDNWQV